MGGGDEAPPGRDRHAWPARLVRGATRKASLGADL